MNSRYKLDFNDSLCCESRHSSKLCFCALLLSSLLIFCQPALAEGETKKDASSTSAFKGMLGGANSGEKLPVFIKSDSLSLDSKSRVFTYSGNVEIIRGDVTITADRVIGRYDEQNQLQSVMCEDNVVLTRGEELRASSNRAFYRISEGTIEMTEAPELARRGNVLSADKITIFVDEDRSEAEGDVRVKVVSTEDAQIGASDRLLKADPKNEEDSGSK